MTALIIVFVVLILGLSGAVAYLLQKSISAQEKRTPPAVEAVDETRQLKELERLRTALYTNITHEFRTPLTVISGMADMIEEDPDGAPAAVEMIKRNSASLLTLVNQMLDLSKLDSGAMDKKMVCDDIISHISYIIDSLKSFAGQQEVGLDFVHERDHFEMDFDPQKIMQIISNLVSNGIKFTPKNGQVDVWTKVLEHDGKETFQVTVRDTGIGIGVEHIPHIFDRFYRIEDTALKTSKGTGIGLALTRDLVELLGGTIEVQSATGKGASFIVELPVTREAPSDAVNISAEEIRSASDAYVSTHDRQLSLHFEGSKNEDHPLALVIEDNEDVSTYIARCLHKNYRLAYASDGEEGIAKAIELVPDVVITDVMMPKKDGFEVSSTLKRHELTSHIPIVILTARADHESKLEGLETGADAYVSKPFDKKELNVRLRKLLELRELLRSRYSSGQTLGKEKDVKISREDAFVMKLNDIIHEHIDDSEFGILELTRAVGLSRAQLHNKIKAITGRSTGLYVRFVRLQKARELLQNNPELNISEIAYDVGFKDPAYFSRCFAEEYGMPPSEAR